jgi:hypothetical protein
LLAALHRPFVFISFSRALNQSLLINNLTNKQNNKMANYILKLQDEVLTASIESAKLDDKINNFLVYLTSEKFWNDTTIQVSEVSIFLNELKMSLPLKEKYTPNQ